MTSNKQPKSISSIIQKPYFRGLAISLTILIATGGSILYSNYHNNNISLRPYTSAKYNFTIGFPDKPKITNSSQKVFGNTLNESEYVGSTANKQNYTVIAFTYPSQINLSKLSQQKLVNILSVQVEAALTITLKASVVGTSQSTFLGHPTVQAIFTVSHKTGFARGFYNGQTEYLVFTTGATKSNFNNFANSFKFNKNNSCQQC